MYIILSIGSKNSTERKRTSILREKYRITKMEEYMKFDPNLSRNKYCLVKLVANSQAYVYLLKHDYISAR